MGGASDDAGAHDDPGRGDHDDSRDTLSTLLRAYGFRVVQAVNGREAIDVARRYHPDLVLMDIMMPEVDGYEATRALRRDGDFAHTPIIAVTALEDARARALEAGMDDCLRKPIRAALPVEKVRSWLPAAEA